MLAARCGSGVNKRSASAATKVQREPNGVVFAASGNSSGSRVALLTDAQPLSLSSKPRSRIAGKMKVTEKKFLNVHQTLSPLLPNGIAAAAAVSAKDLEAAKAAAVATAADKVMVSGERAIHKRPAIF